MGIEQEGAQVVRKTPKRLVAVVNEETFALIKVALFKKGLSTQDALTLAILDWLHIDVSLEQATNLFKIVLEGEASINA